MTLSIAHLGPVGTYAEAAALAYKYWLGEDATLYPYPSIAQTIKAVAEGNTDLAVVPVENSIEGGVTMTLDTLWILDQLQIQQALILPIRHCLLSYGETLEQINTVYSHPQALAQCQMWLNEYLPNGQLVATNATTEGLKYLAADHSTAAIASQRAAELYNIPIVECPINDHPDNATRFWVLSRDKSGGGTHTSLAFSLPENIPGVLVKVLEIFAENHINMSRIESRPTKRSLGEYLFFIDLEADAREGYVSNILAEVEHHTETLKIFGSYSIFNVENEL
jgi:prephenate dehydratase